VIRCLRPCAGLFVAALIAVSACDGNTPTTPTPPPAPAPPATPPAPPPPPPPPAAPAAIESITLSASTVTSQSQTTATVKLTAAAPAGNAAISLETTNSDVAKVPSGGISIAAGQTTGTFTIETSTVRNPTTVTIEAKYLGVAARAELTVVPPGLNALFTVFSASRGADACAISSALGAVDCVLDGAPSTGFPSQYRWTISIAGKDVTVTNGEGTPSFTPSTDCTFLSGGTPASDGTVEMAVSLRVQDRQGNTNGPVLRTVKLYPNAQCGY
jgi:hypothetical protein